jgi:FkbM family methyltransferase
VRDAPDGGRLVTSHIDIAGILRRRGGVRKVLDVGASMGGWFPLWLQLGAERIVAIEPVPDCLAKLNADHGSDPRVTIVAQGASDAPGYMQGLSVHGCWTLLPGIGNGKPTDHGIGRALEFVGKPSFSVSFETIDRILELHDFEPDFIKIDTDGYDAKALRGARSYLDRAHPLVMLELSYLPEVVGDSCHMMVNDCYALGYRMQSFVTGEVFATARDVMDKFPWHTSWDVFLWPPGEVPIS